MSLPAPTDISLTFTGKYRHPREGDIYFWWDDTKWHGPFTCDDPDLSWAHAPSHYAIYHWDEGPKVLVILDSAFQPGDRGEVVDE